MITEHTYPTLYFPKVDGKFINNNNRNALTDDEDHAMYSLHSEDALTNANRKGWFTGVEIFELKFQYRLEYYNGFIWQSQRYYRTLLAGEVGFFSYIRRASFTGLKDCVWRLIDINTKTTLRKETPSEWMVKNDA